MNRTTKPTASASVKNVWCSCVVRFTYQFENAVYFGPVFHVSFSHIYCDKCIASHMKSNNSSFAANTSLFTYNAQWLRVGLCTHTQPSFSCALCAVYSLVLFLTISVALLFSFVVFLFIFHFYSRTHFRWFLW